MKMLCQVQIPNDTFNAATRDGTVGSKMGRILEDTRPEVVYFTEIGGKRGAILVVDVADATKIPALAEPWFLTFNADVQFHILISPEELKRSNLNDLGKKWS